MHRPPRTLRAAPAALLVLAACHAPETGEGSGLAAPDTGPAASPVTAEPTAERLVSVMGTLAHVEVWDADRPRALAASEAAVRALEKSEARLSTWRQDTPLARLNAAPAEERVPIPARLFQELARARALSAATGRAFDPGVGGLVRAWDLRGKGRIPSEAVVADLVAGGTIGAMVLRDGWAARGDERLILDEGGFGKGAGLEEALDALRDAGATRASIDLGGQVAVLPDGAPYAISIADPRDRSRAVLSVTITTGSVATTSNSERGLVVEGRPIGHVLDPRSGHPAHEDDPALRGESVSVWAPRALDADALSTALFVMQPDEALAFAEGRPDTEALILIPTATGLRLRVTSGWRDRVAPLVPELEVEPGSPAEAPPSSPR